jgi:hypothetical protein
VVTYIYFLLGRAILLALHASSNIKLKPNTSVVKVIGSMQREECRARDLHRIVSSLGSPSLAHLDHHQHQGTTDSDAKKP